MRNLKLLLFSLTLLLQSSQLFAQDMNLSVRHNLGLLQRCDSTLTVTLIIAGKAYGVQPGQTQVYFDVDWTNGSQQITVPLTNINAGIGDFYTTAQRPFLNNGPVNVTVKGRFTPSGNIIGSNTCLLPMGKPSDCMPIEIRPYSELSSNCQKDDAAETYIYTKEIKFSINDSNFTGFPLIAKLPNFTTYTIKVFSSKPSGGQNQSYYQAICDSVKVTTSGGIIEFPFNYFFTPGDSTILETNISYNHDSICGIPRPGRFAIQINNSYQPQSKVTVKINFGDGSDTTVNTNASLAKFLTVKHTYTIAGIYHSKLEILFSDTSFSFTKEITLSADCGAISGKLYLDKNNNCTLDIGEKGLANKIIRNSVGTQSYYTITDTAGNYSFSADNSQSYIVNFTASDTTSYSTCNGAYSISSLPALNKNFGIKCPNVSYDFVVGHTDWGYRPGREAYLNMSVSNRSCEYLVDGTLMATLSDKVNFKSAIPAPYLVVGNKAYWSVTNLAPDEVFRVSAMLTTKTTATINDTICIQTNIATSLPDENPLNNTHYTCMPVRASYDPNDKTAFVNSNPSPIGDFTKSDYIDYRIRFQNTGNDTAFDIFVLDTLDANLDLSSFKIIGQSHPMKVYLNDNRLIRFEFTNILLPDDKTNEAKSQGFVMYSLKPLKNLSPGTKIRNTAYIYFDYNDPIITNTTENQLVLVSGIPSVNESDIRFYPNPSNNILNLTSSSTITKVTIIDMLGKSILIITDTNGIKTIDVANLANGVYLLQIQQGENTQTHKFTVSHE